MEINNGCVILFLRKTYFPTLLDPSETARQFSSLFTIQKTFCRAILETFFYQRFIGKFEYLMPSFRQLLPFESAPNQNCFNRLPTGQATGQAG